MLKTMMNPKRVFKQNREVEEVDLSESEKSTYRGRKNRLQGVGKTDFKRSENTTYRGRKNQNYRGRKKSTQFNTKYNYTDISNTDRNNTDLINLFRFFRTAVNGFDGRDGVIPDEYCTCKKKY